MHPDLKSGVESLKKLFSKLNADAKYEADHYLGQFLCKKSCLEVAEKFNQAEKICEKFLNLQLCIAHLVLGVRKLNFGQFLYQIIEFLPSHLAIQIIMEDDNGNIGDIPCDGGDDDGDSDYASQDIFM